MIVGVPLALFVAIAGAVLLLRGRGHGAAGVSGALEELDQRIRTRMDTTGRRADAALVRFCEEQRLTAFDRLSTDVYEYFWAMLQQQGLRDANLFRAQLDQLTFVNELRLLQHRQGRTERNAIEVTLGALALVIGLFASVAQIYSAVADRHPQVVTPPGASTTSISTSTTPSGGSGSLTSGELRSPSSG